MTTGEVVTQYPIMHWSDSSMKKFLSNRLQFKKEYILKKFDSKSSPAMMVGKACHAAAEVYWRAIQSNRSPNTDQMLEAGLQLIEKTDDDKIKYGKTGSRNKIIEDFTQGINFYLAEVPSYTNILGVEKSLTHFITVNGLAMPLPAKAKIDLYFRDEVGIVIVDHKFSTSFTDPEEDRASFVLQSMFNFHTVWAETGERPYKMIFDETKITKNSRENAGKPQREPYTIIFDQHPDFFGFFAQIYSDCTREIGKPDCSYLPNITDQYTGQDSFEEYRNGIITIEAPVAVSHRTEIREYVEKKFIPSPVDLVENQHLTNEEKIRSKLLEFGLAVEMKETYKGHNITLYTLKPSRGAKMSVFEGYAKDVALALKAKSVRIEAPIPGTDTIGIEVPNEERTICEWSDRFCESNSLTIPIGVNVYREVIKKNLEDMPHLLVAGTTNSGKSVMINSIIHTLSKQNTPDQLRLILVDPKRVEFTQFKSLPHLECPVIFDEEKAAKVMKWLVQTMEFRYGELEKSGARNINEHNRQGNSMPKIVVIVDEFADLIMQYQDKGEEESSTERNIVRLAQKARAVGIHLILGTQRPDVKVVTGKIKANIPTRIAFMTTSRVDSQIILDQSGAEDLQGKGDLLFMDPSTKGVQRLQGLLC